MSASVAFDLQAINRRLDAYDSKGPLSRNLASSLFMAQTVNSMLYSLLVNPADGLPFPPGEVPRSEDWVLTGRTITAETFGAPGVTDNNDVTFDFTSANAPIMPGTAEITYPGHTSYVWTVGVPNNATAVFSATSNFPVVPGSFSMPYQQHGAGGAGLITDDGAGNLVSDIPLDLAGVAPATNYINYATGAVHITFDAGKEPDVVTVPGEFDATQDNADVTIVDDGAGGWTASAGAEIDEGLSTIAYDTGVIHFVFTAAAKAPGVGALEMTYDVDSYEDHLRDARVALTAVITSLNSLVK